MADDAIGEIIYPMGRETGVVSLSYGISAARTYLDADANPIVRVVPADDLYQIAVYAIDEDGKPLRIESQPGSFVMVAPANCRLVTRAEWLAAGGRDTSPLERSIL